VSNHLRHSNTRGIDRDDRRKPSGVGRPQRGSPLEKKNASARRRRRKPGRNTHRRDRRVACVARMRAYRAVPAQPRQRQRAHLRYGVSKGEYVAFLDADMDLHPEQLEEFFAIMKARDADVVIGSKFHPQSKVEYPRLRRIYSFFYFMLVRSLFGLPVRDTQTGIKLFKREVLERVLPRVLVKRFAFDLELLANVHHFGYRIVEAPVVVNFNRVCSRLRLAAVWNVFVDTLAIFYRMRILRYYDQPRRSNKIDRAGSHEIVIPITVGE
jgi:glycosyltransferase involved in cell wall biosynthesis